MPELLPESVQKDSKWGPRERRICDYVSGMTDRYAINEHRNLYSADEGI
jgi:dGTP triphosphohydrolase